MAQLFTAQFINDSWFITWLSPTVTVNEALTGVEKWVFTMVETSAWNYVYERKDSNDSVVYFAKYDAGAEAINRYQWANNRVESTVNTRVGGGSVTYTNVITKEKMKEIAEMVVEMLPKQKEIVLDTSKIEEKLGTIDEKIENIDIEFDYWTILSWQQKNTQEIIKKIDKIKIPEYNDEKLVEEVKNIIPEIRAINIPDNMMKLNEIQKKVEEVKDVCDIICEDKTEEEDEKYKESIDKIEEVIKKLKPIRKKDKQNKKEAEKIIEEFIKDEEIFNSLIEN